MKVDKKSGSITFSKKETKAVLTYIIKELEKPDSSKLRIYRKHNKGVCYILKMELWKMHSLEMRKYKITKRCFCKNFSITKCLYHTFSTWEHFSGHYDFPIMDCSSSLPLWEQFAVYNHWKEEQLELRMDLLKHLKKELFNVVIRTPPIWR